MLCSMPLSQQGGVTVSDMLSMSLTPVRETSSVVYYSAPGSMGGSA